MTVLKFSCCAAEFTFDVGQGKLTEVHLAKHAHLLLEHRFKMGGTWEGSARQKGGVVLRVKGS